MPGNPDAAGQTPPPGQFGYRRVWFADMVPMRSIWECQKTGMLIQLQTGGSPTPKIQVGRPRRVQSSHRGWGARCRETGPRSDEILYSFFGFPVGIFFLLLPDRLRGIWRGHRMRHRWDGSHTAPVQVAGGKLC
jgi:hypothetical protein